MAARFAVGLAHSNHLQRLRRRSRERRAAALRAFALERVPPFVALERVLRSMTAVAFLEHPDVLAAIGEESMRVGDPAVVQVAAS